MACRVLDRAIQVHGALGVCQDSPLAHWFAGARRSVIMWHLANIEFGQSDCACLLGFFAACALQTVLTSCIWRLWPNWSSKRKPNCDFGPCVEHSTITVCVCVHVRAFLVRGLLIVIVLFLSYSFVTILLNGLWFFVLGAVMSGNVWCKWLTRTCYQSSTDRYVSLICFQYLDHQKNIMTCECHRSLNIS